MAVYLESFIYMQFLVNQQTNNSVYLGKNSLYLWKRPISERCIDTSSDADYHLVLGITRHMKVAKANRTKHKSWSHMPPPYLLATARRETTSALARAAAHMMKYCGPLFPRFLLFFDSGIYS